MVSLGFQRLSELKRLILISAVVANYVYLIDVPALIAYSHDERVRIVARQEILEAMQQQQGYDPTATTNVARFQAQVLLYLIRSAREREPEGPPLFMDHTDWFFAFLEKNNITVAQAPTFALLSYQHKQDQLVEYRSQRVIKKVQKGPKPIVAANVKVFWTKEPGRPSKYSFHDTLSTPNLKVTNHRLITYRLLEFEDMIVIDDIHGLTGRPTSGILGLLFRVIGEGRAVQSRFTISRDGLQINRSQVRKGHFEVTETVTVQPDGNTQKGLPPGRPDLLTLEARLKRPLRIKYLPFKISD
ncbi:MAG: hypothetical protein ACE5NG_05530 [bacterium]